MHCIFCKTCSDDCVSVEHIVPESLGNTEHVLPKGWVCDTCNNYFAREVEKPFLDSSYGRSSRFEMAVANKRGRIPTITGLHFKSRTKVELFRSRGDPLISVAAAEGEDETRWIADLQSRSRGVLYVPTATLPPEDAATSRFMGKVGLEALALRCIDVVGANQEIVNNVQLDELRRHVRLGNKGSTWPVRHRRLHSADVMFSGSDGEPFQILHEWTLLYTSQSECYAVVSIFGVEYTINLGGPEIEGYDRWLRDNGNRSPLYETGLPQ